MKKIFLHAFALILSTTMNAAGLTPTEVWSMRFEKDTPAPFLGIFTHTETKAGIDEKLEGIRTILDANPFISGVEIRIRWFQLHPEPDVFYLDKLEALVDLISSRGKLVGLTVVPGFNTPDWVYAAGAACVGPVTIGSVTTNTVLPWDPVFMELFTKDIRAIAARFANDPRVFAVTVQGHNYKGAEMHTPKPDTLIKSQRGWRRDSVMENWDYWMNLYGDLFPDKKLILVISQSYSDDTLPEELTRRFVEKFKGRAVLQTHQLQGVNSSLGMSGDICRTFSRQAPVSHEMLGSFVEQPQRQGPAEQTVEKALKIGNPLFLQIWNRDALDPQYAQALLAAWKKNKHASAALDSYRSGFYTMGQMPVAGGDFLKYEKVLEGNPYLTGALIHPRWEQLEETDGKFDFSAADQTFKIFRDTGKKCAMVVSGAHPPEFVYQAGAERFTYPDNNPHHPGYSDELSMPLPWDPVWQKYYTRLLRAVGERYSSNPTLESVVVTCSRTAEMHFPRTEADLKKWAQYRDYKEKVVEAYKRIMDATADAFPRQQLVLMVSQMFNSEDSGSTDAELIQEIIEYGLANYPERFTLQTNQLDGRRDNRGKMSYDIIMKYKDLLHHGFQSVASFKTTPIRQGAMEMAVLNYLRAGAEYWEVWRGDGMDPAICKKLVEVLDEACELGVDAYEQKLKKEGLFRTSEDDTYRP